MSWEQKITNSTVKSTRIMNPSSCKGVSLFYQISEKKNLEFTSEFWLFSLSHEFYIFFTASCLSNFVSTEASWTILSIYRSESRFESDARVKIRKTLENDRNFDDFV